MRDFPLSILGLFCLFGACAFEQDEQYFPQTEGGYCLVLDETEQASLLKILPDDELLFAYESQLGVAAGGLSDMDIWEAELALAEPSESRVRTLSLPSETALQSYSTTPYQVHLLALGRRRIFGYDSLANQLLWLDKSDGRAVTLPLEGKIDFIGYLEPFFYLVNDSNRFLIWHEATLSQVEDATLAEPIIYVIEHPVLNRFFPITRQDGIQTLYAWDFGPRVLINQGPKVYRKWLVSPYRRQRLGTEWLPVVEIRGDRITSPRIEPVEDYAVDFLQSQLYYYHSDSLWRRDLQTEETRFLGPF
ncbi:MAG: hypothetical protein AAGM67_03930, partial [Bacteroidota bacterium]